MHMFQLNSSILLVFAPFHEVDLLSPRGLARFFGVSIPPSVESRMETVPGSPLARCPSPINNAIGGPSRLLSILPSVLLLGSLLKFNELK